MQPAPTGNDKPRPAILAVLAMIAALLAGLIAQAWPADAKAQDAAEGVEVELDLDAIEEPPPASPHGGGDGIRLLDDKVRIMGRFDATYELANPAEDDPLLRKGDVKSYHHHLFVKVNASKKVGLFAEVVDGLFAEFSYRPAPALEFKAGKILVPFGDPGFHHFYAAVQGDPLTGILVPNVWAEYGATASWEVGHLGPVSIVSETYSVKGSYEKDPGKVLLLNRPSAGNRFALGERLTLGWDRIRVSGSVYWDEWNRGYDLYLWGADATIDYGFVKLPVLRDLRLKGGLAYADVENPELGDYYKYADYAELAYGGIREWVTPRLRYGSYIDDSRAYTQRDLHNWSGALVVPIDVLTLTLEYLWQMEEIDELDNDLFRAMLALDF